MSWSDNLRPSETEVFSMAYLTLRMPGMVVDISGQDKIYRRANSGRVLASDLRMFFNLSVRTINSGRRSGEK